MILKGIWRSEKKLSKKPIQRFWVKNEIDEDFLGGPVVKNPVSDSGDVGSIPGQGNKIPPLWGN